MSPKVSRKPVPLKLFYRIQEVAEITGVKPHVLRYWETEFKQLAPRKDMNDQRRYTPRDIETVRQIKELLYDQKFTIAGARRQLNRQKTQKTLTRAVDPGFISDMRRDINELLSLLDKQELPAA